jgi:hypothetical protein
MPARRVIDWQRIIEKITGSGGHPSDLFFFIIPDAGRQLLLSQSTALKWPTTYGLESLDDELEEIVDDTIRALMESENMSEIADAIRYLADQLEPDIITQNNTNQGGGGGSGCGCQDTWLTEPPTFPEDETLPMFPPDPDGVTTQSALDMCKVAEYFADLWEDNFSDISTYWSGIGITVDAITTWIQRKFPQGAVIPFLALIVTSLAVALETALLGSVLESAATAASAQKEQIKCAIGSARTAAEAKTNFHNVLASARATYGRVTYAILYLVAQMIDWTKMTDGTVPIPIEYEGTTCCNDESLLPAGVVALPLVAGTYETLNGGVVSFDGNGILTVTGTGANQGGVIIPDLSSLGYTWGKDNGSYSRGYEITLLEMTGAFTGQVWIQSGSLVFHNTLSPINVGDVNRGGLSSIQDWIDAGDVTIPHNSFISRPRLRVVTANGSGSFTLKFKVTLVTGTEAAT